VTDNIAVKLDPSIMTKEEIKLLTIKPLLWAAFLEAFLKK
jgi:hypothetical protein